MKDVTTTTVTKEYDAEGKLVKETTETVTEHECDGETVIHQHYHWSVSHGGGCSCASCKPLSHYPYTWTSPNIGQPYYGTTTTVGLCPPGTYTTTN